MRRHTDSWLRLKYRISAQSIIENSPAIVYYESLTIINLYKCHTLHLNTRAKI